LGYFKNLDCGENVENVHSFSLVAGDSSAEISVLAWAATERQHYGGNAVVNKKQVYCFKRFYTYGKNYPLFLSA